jgi:ribokinase
MNVAVVGHVEWIEFVRVEHVPQRGEIVHAQGTWAEAAGGGAVAAVQLARLAGSSTLFTAVGDDELGGQVAEELARYGVQVHAAVRAGPQRRGFTYVDAEGERTITVIGERVGPRRSDDLPWEQLEELDGVYFVSGDPAAVRAARAAKILVATARSLADLREARVTVDALVRSRNDESETYKPGDLDPPPRIEVATVGHLGGSYTVDGGSPSHFHAADVPGPIHDTYGAGDSFAAGLTYGLADALPVEDAIGLAARTGAAALTRRGAHGPS